MDGLCYPRRHWHFDLVGGSEAEQGPFSIFRAALYWASQDMRHIWEAPFSREAM